jgi:hypothetical protein
VPDVLSAPDEAAALRAVIEAKDAEIAVLRERNDPAVCRQLLWTGACAAGRARVCGNLVVVLDLGWLRA